MTETLDSGDDCKADSLSEPTVAPTKLRKFYDALLAAYGPQQWWPARSPFEVVIGAYLTQNTSWRGVERSIDNLRQQNALTIEGIRSVPIDELRGLIRPSGYMVRKAMALKAFVAMLDHHYAGSLGQLASVSTETARTRLLALPGVGEETADAILLYALGHPVFVIDEYYRRVVTRHRVMIEPFARPRPRYGELQQLAHRAFATDEAGARTQLYNEFHALIVAVGKRHCGPTPRCEGCPLADDLVNCVAAR